MNSMPIPPVDPIKQLISHFDQLELINGSCDLDLIECVGLLRKVDGEYVITHKYNGKWLMALNKGTTLAPDNQEVIQMLWERLIRRPAQVVIQPASLGAKRPETFDELIQYLDSSKTNPTVYSGNNGPSATITKKNNVYTIVFSDFAGTYTLRKEEGGPVLQTPTGLRMVIEDSDGKLSKDKYWLTKLLNCIFPSSAPDTKPPSPSSQPVVPPTATPQSSLSSQPVVLPAIPLSFLPSRPVLPPTAIPQSSLSSQPVASPTAVPQSSLSSQPAAFSVAATQPTSLGAKRPETIDELWQYLDSSKTNPTTYSYRRETTTFTVTVTKQNDKQYTVVFGDKPNVIYTATKGDQFLRSNVDSVSAVKLLNFIFRMCSSVPDTKLPSPSSQPAVPPTATPQSSLSSQPVASPTAVPQSSLSSQPVASPTAVPQSSLSSQPAAFSVAATQPTSLGAKRPETIDELWQYLGSSKTNPTIYTYREGTVTLTVTVTKQNDQQYTVVFGNEPDEIYTATKGDRLLRSNVNSISVIRLLNFIFRMHSSVPDTKLPSPFSQPALSGLKFETFADLIQHLDFSTTNPTTYFGDDGTSVTITKEGSDYTVVFSDMTGAYKLRRDHEYLFSPDGRTRFAISQVGKLLNLVCSDPKFDQILLRAILTNSEQAIDDWGKEVKADPDLLTEICKTAVGFKKENALNEKLYPDIMKLIQAIIFVCVTNDPPKSFELLQKIPDSYVAKFPSDYDIIVLTSIEKGLRDYNLINKQIFLNQEPKVIEAFYALFLGALTYDKDSLCRVAQWFIDNREKYFQRTRSYDSSTSYFSTPDWYLACGKCNHLVDLAKKKKIPFNSDLPRFQDVRIPAFKPLPNIPILERPTHMLMFRSKFERSAMEALPKQQRIHAVVEYLKSKKPNEINDKCINDLIKISEIPEFFFGSDFDPSKEGVNEQFYRMCEVVSRYDPIIILKIDNMKFTNELFIYNKDKMHELISRVAIYSPSSFLHLDPNVLGKELYFDICTQAVQCNPEVLSYICRAACDVKIPPSLQDQKMVEEYSNRMTYYHQVISACINSNPPKSFELLTKIPSFYCEQLAPGYRTIVQNAIYCGLKDYDLINMQSLLQPTRPMMEESFHLIFLTVLAFDPKALNWLGKRILEKQDELLKQKNLEDCEEVCRMYEWLCEVAQQKGISKADDSLMQLIVEKAKCEKMSRYEFFTRALMMNPNYLHTVNEQRLKDNADFFETLIIFAIRNKINVYPNGIPQVLQREQFMKALLQAFPELK